jgi:hypothetical protein
MKLKNLVPTLLLVMAIIALFSAGCSDKEKEAHWKNKLDSLSSVTNSRDSIINDLLSSFNEIETSLDSVNSRQMIIMNNVESDSRIKGSAKERINENISLINKLMDDNRAKIESLTKKLRSSVSKLVAVEKTLALLQEQITRKDVELTEMNGRLSRMSDSIFVLKTSVDTLTRMGQAQAQFISDQTKEMHTAYYVVGEKKELQEKKIVNSEGGVLGLGKTQKIAGNVDEKAFSKIDYTITTTIPINSRKVKILTSHPSDSYAMDKNGNGEITAIRITSPQKFWSVNKYLVVVKG